MLQRYGKVRRYATVLTTMIVMTLAVTNVQAATEFAAPGFRTAYYAGEGITPNFWGPLSHASDPLEQLYNGSKRTIQYFDKGRMEFTNGQVTFGLLATEMVTGRLQAGDQDFVNLTPPNKPVAGDEDGQGATYLDIYNNRSLVLTGTPNRVGQEFSLYFVKGQFVSDRSGAIGLRAVALTDYDNTTRHNVIQVFRRYRDVVGFSTIGYAISEPFASYFTVGGVQTAVIVQVFERRVLTYTPDNPPDYQVEMGNIGRHYFFWRNIDN